MCVLLYFCIQNDMYLCNMEVFIYFWFILTLIYETNWLFLAPSIESINFSDKSIIFRCIIDFCLFLLWQLLTRDHTLPTFIHVFVLLWPITSGLCFSCNLLSTLLSEVGRKCITIQNIRNNQYKIIIMSCVMDPYALCILTYIIMATFTQISYTLYYFVSTVLEYLYFSLYFTLQNIKKILYFLLLFLLFFAFYITSYQLK